MTFVPRASRSDVPELIAESESLEARMEPLQREGRELEDGEVQAVRRDYREWLSRARMRVSEESRKKFDEQAEGSFFAHGIKRYLNDPRELSPFVNDEGEYPLGKWLVPFSQVKERMERQRALVIASESESTPSESVAADLAEVFGRVPEMIRILERTSKSSIQVKVENEADLQVIVESLLRSLFEDVRREEHSPSFAGAGTRIDFLLPDLSLAIEVKMMRESLTSRQLGEELLADLGRYPRHPDCETILFFIYDPNHYLTNPRGVEGDLTSQTGDGIAVTCVVAS